MRTLSLALYCEGNTDKLFLPGIIQRTAEKLLSKHATNDVDLLPVFVVDVAKQEKGRDILQVAIQIYGHDMSIIPYISSSI